MSKCPFWSSSKKNIDCYEECPMLMGESVKKTEEQCIFHECTSSGDITFKDEIKEEYNFLNLHVYDDEKTISY